MDNQTQPFLSEEVDFQHLFESVPGAILVLRTDLTIVAVSNEYLRATQTQRELIVGRGIFEVFPDNPAEEGATGVTTLRGSLERVLTTRRFDSMAVQKYDIREGGEGPFIERYWSPTNHPVLGPGGEVRYILHQVQDVTEFIRKYHLGTVPQADGIHLDPQMVELDIVRRAHEIQEANLELRTSQEQLQGQFLDRTQALAEAMEAIGKRDELLRQANKMEALGRLAGGIAHDFNNLLTVIYTCAEQLTRKLGDIPHLNLLKTASERGAGLTQQLLTFSRQQVMTLKVLDLGSILSTSGNLLARVLGEDIDVKIISEPNLRKVQADLNQIDQVIMNLAINARDAMPNGGLLTLEAADVDLDENYARCHPGVKAGPYVMLAVSDNGMGMDKATQARAFDPFFTTKGAGKGTGLGLATVFGIVQQTGGHIFLYSEPGSGTTFKIFFPEIPAGLDEQVPDSILESDPLDEIGEGKLLVVEDEESVRAMIQDLLVEIGYEVDVVQDGNEALQVISSSTTPFDLIITDVIMPGLNGRELSSRVDKIRPGTKVLFLSGYTNDAVLRNGVLEAGLPFLQKPFSTSQLRRKVREVLRNQNPA